MEQQTDDTIEMTEKEKAFKAVIQSIDNGFVELEKLDELILSLNEKLNQSSDPTEEL